MAAPTNAAYVKKALANSEPSTHGCTDQCCLREESSCQLGDVHTWLHRPMLLSLRKLLPTRSRPHMAAPTNASYVKKALANSEPSTHGCTDQCCLREESSCQLGAVHTWLHRPMLLT